MAGDDPGIERTELLALLADETRLAILRALWERMDWVSFVRNGQDPVSFSELRRTAGVSDSGNFTHHLAKLSNTLVTEHDDGYALSPPGAEVLRALTVELEADPPRIPETTLAHSCPLCGGDLVGEYDTEALIVRCTDCPGLESAPRGTIYKSRVVSTGAEDRSVSELLATDLVRFSAFETAAQRGRCPACAGRVSTELDACTDHQHTDTLCTHCGHAFAVYRTHACQDCGVRSWAPAMASAATEPAVRSFFADHGITTTTALTPGVFFALNRIENESLVSRDPVSVEYLYARDGDRLRVTITDRDDRLDISTTTD